MRIAHTRSEIGDRQGTRGFVPTMGALHEGHLSLVRRSVSENEETVVSIFVNPTQFGPSEDFSRYPRTLEQDLLLAESAGADVVYVPTVDEIYHGSSISVRVSGPVSQLWEAAIRPGHFDGVATVVSKLFNIVGPTSVYFGQKDLQQCAVIQSMIAELFMPIQFVMCETTREDDGLAMSSRNRYLDAEQRAAARNISQLLSSSKSIIRQGESISHVLDLAKIQLNSVSTGVDYLAAISLPSMEPTAYDVYAGQPTAIIAAVRFGQTRLLDNMVL